MIFLMENFRNEECVHILSHITVYSLYYMNSCVIMHPPSAEMQLSRLKISRAALLVPDGNRTIPFTSLQLDLQASNSSRRPLDYLTSC